MAGLSLVEEGGADGVALEGSLKELVETSSLKWIFVGGKGGVGKTTTSCTLAVQLAARRESVLIISTDPAHNISDAFSQKFSSEPTLVKGFTNLYAMEINSSYQESGGFNLTQLHAADAMTENSNNNNNLSSSFSSSDPTTLFPNISKLIPEMMQAVPGIDEALSFAELMQSVQTMKYNVIVFDTAPTGHTLRLLSFPDLLEKGLRKVSAFKEKIQAAVNMLNAVSGQKLQEQDFTAKIENLKALTTSVRETFEDASRTTFVCVCVPEFLSLYETERLIQELAKQKIDCSNIVVNQVLFPIDALYDTVGKEDVNPPPETLYPRPPGEIWMPTSARQLLEDPLAVQQEQHKDEEEEEKSERTLQEENQKLRSFVYAVQRRLLALEKSYYSRRAMQSKYLEQIQLLYAEDFHVVAMPQQPQEVRGLDRLKQFGELLLQPRPLPIIPLSA